MKTNHDIVHSGTMGSADRTRMSFHEDSMAHLMSVLTDLYRDPELAIIREYSTNAFDAHVEAGVSKPIEVTVPTMLNPSLVIKDFGVGMTADEIRNNYSQYGYSSKRDTDEQVGMLGLGCKSALAHTSQFTIIAVKNGMRTLALITRESDGAGAVQIISEEPTGDPNGVEVIVPMRAPYSVAQKVTNFFRFWDPGTVLVNGKEPESVWDNVDGNSVQIDPDVILTRTDSDYIVMGNVAYPIKGDILGNKFFDGRTMRVVARVPIGSVNFTPSREALMETARTRDTVETLTSFVHHQLTVATQKSVDKATTPYEAMSLVLPMRSISRVQYKRFTYRGATVPTILRAQNGRTYRSHMSSKQIDRIEANDADSFQIIVTGFPNRPPTEPQRDRIEAAVKDLCPEEWWDLAVRRHHQDLWNNRNLRASVLLCQRVSEGEAWMGCPVISWKDLKEKYSLPGDDKPRKALDSVRICALGRQERPVSIEDKALDSVEFWIPMRASLDTFMPMNATVRDAMHEVGMDMKEPCFALVATRHVERFRKLHPKVPTATEFYLKLRWMLLNKLSQDSITHDVSYFISDSLRRTAINGMSGETSFVTKKDGLAIADSCLDKRVQELLKVYIDIKFGHTNTVAHTIFANLHSQVKRSLDFFIPLKSVKGHSWKRIVRRLENQVWPEVTRRDAMVLSLYTDVMRDYPMLGYAFAPTNGSMVAIVNEWVANSSSMATFFTSGAASGPYIAATTTSSATVNTTISYNGGAGWAPGRGYVWSDTNVPVSKTTDRKFPNRFHHVERLEKQAHLDALREVIQYINFKFMLNNGLVNPTPVF